MSNELWTYIDGISIAEPGLPLMHTTDGFGLREMAASQRLETRECTVFSGEELLYLFYGRPAYRPHLGREASRQLPFAPVCMILNADISANFKRVFPFDTGAFVSGLYEKHLHPAMKLDSFLLPSNVLAAQSVVAKFYLKNLSYFRGTPIEDMKVDPGEFEADCYYKLICDDSASWPDDRASAIELQVGDPINLDADTVQAIICPTQALEVSSIVEAMDAWDVEPYTYELHRGSTPEYQGLVYEKVESFLDSMDLI